MLPIRTILHPTDFSENSEWAFDLACALAKDYGARLIVVHVALPPAIFYGEGLMVSEPVNYLDDLRKKLYHVQPGHPGIPMEHRLVEGDAAEGILALIEETNSDLIVMGTHGRIGLSRLLMGSVAEKVVRRAPCPVLTLKRPVPIGRRSEQPAVKSAGTPVAVG